MEVLGFSIVCSIFGFIGVKFKNMKFADILSNVIGSAGGEAVEEAIESVLSVVFPKSFFYIRTKGSEKRILAEQLTAMFRAMADDTANGSDKWYELRDFLQSHPVDGKKKGVPICENISDKRALKDFGQALKELYKSSKSKQTDRIRFLTGEELVREIYGIKNADERIPEALLEFSDLIGSYVYERLYIGLSSDDRDLAKVFQFMLVSNNKQITDAVREEIRDTLRDTLSIILQHHEDGTLSTLSVVDKEKGGPADPYFYIKLVCPECGAAADYVHRRGDRVFCRCCGGSYDIVRNAEPEVVEKIAELQVQLEERLTKNGIEIGTQVRAQLREMAEKTVSAEYFDRKMVALQANTAQAAQAVILDVEQMAKSLSKRMDSVDRYLEALRLQEAEHAQELQQGLTAAIRRENQTLQMQALMMQNQLTQIDSQTSEALLLMRAIESKGVSLDADSLQKINDFMSRFEKIFKEEIEKKTKEEIEKKTKGGTAPAPRRPARDLHARVCPTCGKYVEFEYFAGNEWWQCPVCDARLRSVDDKVPLKRPVPVELEYTNGIVELRLASEVQNHLSDYDAETVKIRLRYADVTRMKGTDVDNHKLKRLKRNGLTPTQVVLCADSNCYFNLDSGRNVPLLSQLLSALRFDDQLKKLVIGENVVLPPTVAEFLDGSNGKWKRSDQGRLRNVFERIENS